MQVKFRSFSFPRSFYRILNSCRSCYLISFLLLPARKQNILHFKCTSWHLFFSPLVRIICISNDAFCKYSFFCSTNEWRIRTCSELPFKLQMKKCKITQEIWYIFHYYYFRMLVDIMAFFMSILIAFYSLIYSIEVENDWNLILHIHWGIQWMFPFL